MCSLKRHLQKRFRRKHSVHWKDRLRTEIVTVTEATDLREVKDLKEVTDLREVKELTEDPLTEVRIGIRVTDHRVVTTEIRVTAVQDKVDMSEAIRKEQAASMAAEKEIKATDRRAADLDLIKQKAACSLALISQVGRVIAVVTLLQQAVTGILKIVTVVADLMADREIDSAVSQKLRALQQKLLPKTWKRSVKKKRDVSVRKKTNVTKRITSMRKKKH